MRALHITLKSVDEDGISQRKRLFNFKKPRREKKNMENGDRDKINQNATEKKHGVFECIGREKKRNETGKWQMHFAWRMFCSVASSTFAWFPFDVVSFIWLKRNTHTHTQNRKRSEKYGEKMSTAQNVFYCFACQVNAMPMKTSTAMSFQCDTKWIDCEPHDVRSQVEK